MQERIVDVAVIGAGTAGVRAFNTLKAAGRKVVLIDRGPLGTSCARVGCMPSKAVLHAGMRWSTARGLPAGATLDASGPPALWAHAIQTRDALAGGAAERTRRAAGDDLIMAEAHFLAPGVLQAGATRVQARAVVVATGSQPAVPKALMSLAPYLLTTDSLFEQQQLPARLGVLGLGAIGLELGLGLSRLDVQVVGADQAARIGGIQDPEILARALARFGQEMPLWLGQPVTLEEQGAAVLMRAGEHRATVDRVLVATGRVPNTAGLDLAAAGVALDAQGRPVIDPATLRAGDAPIYFAGDVQPDRPLMHEAADEGLLAARAALAWLDGQAQPASRRSVPLSILFTDPDVCQVGMGYDEAMAAGARVAGAQGSGNGRSKVLGAPDNLLHLYVAPGSGRLLGAAMMTTHGEHLAHQLAWAIQAGQTVEDLLAMPYYHPSIEEMLQSALQAARAA